MMESTTLPLEGDDEGRPQQASSTGSGASSGAGYYGHKNGEYQSLYSLAASYLYYKAERIVFWLNAVISRTNGSIWKKFHLTRKEIVSEYYVNVNW